MSESHASAPDQLHEAQRSAEATATGTETRDPDAATPPTPPGAPPSTPSVKPMWVPQNVPPFQMPTAEQYAQIESMNNCGVRAVMSGVGGAVLGLGFGVFFGTMETSGGGGVYAPMVMDEKKTTRQVFKEMYSSVKTKSVSYAKGFGTVGLLFSASECVVEKARAKHDWRNSAYAGCFSGAALAYKGGPWAMCTGCAGFAAFSVVIDKVMGNH
ncbi:unnamed protein product [Pedinophyceae sp. YPF-701]|nr:unnamed protein product [Pedinophyceae sp. YPF-701]